VTLVSLAVLPDRVAIHFGVDGLADGWATKQMHVLLITGLHVVLFLALYIQPWLVMKVPARWISMPHKDYWLAPENRPRTLAIVRWMMWHVAPRYLCSSWW